MESEYTNYTIVKVGHRKETLNEACKRYELNVNEVKKLLNSKKRTFNQIFNSGLLTKFILKQRGERMAVSQDESPLARNKKLNEDTFKDFMKKNGWKI